MHRTLEQRDCFGVVECPSHVAPLQHINAGLFSSGFGQKFGFVTFHALLRTLKMPFASYHSLSNFKPFFKSLGQKLQLKMQE